MEITEWIKIYSLCQTMVAGEDTPESYLKDGIDWILKNLFLAIELLITGTVFQRTVLVARCYIILNLISVCTGTGNWTVLCNRIEECRCHMVLDCVY